MNRQIFRDYLLNTRFVFQKLVSDRGLINSEQINITGPGHMSGYESGNMSGDQGFLVLVLPTINDQPQVSLAEQKWQAAGTVLN